MPGVDIVADHILVYGNNIHEHNTRLKALLQSARKVNLKLNKKKIANMQNRSAICRLLLTKERLKPYQTEFKL